MPLSKSAKPPHLFTQKANGTGAQVAFTTSTQRQWKLKELLLERSLAGAVTLNVYLRDTKAGKDYLLATVAGATTPTIRIAPTLSTGEYFVDQDAEIKVTTTGIGGAETWTLRVTGALVS